MKNSGGQPRWTLKTGARRAFLLCIGALAVPAAAEIVILRSTSTSYYAGQRLPDSATLRLARGEQVLVLRQRVTRQFCGPGAFRVDRPANLVPCTRPSDGSRVGAVSSSAMGTPTSGRLILRSMGPSAGRYRVGTRMPPSGRLELRPGDAVVVLMTRGPQAFRGPGTYRLDGSAPRVAGVASANRRMRTGAVRTPGDATGSQARPSSLWQLDVSRSGRACVLPNVRPTLWREDSGQGARLTITPGASERGGEPQSIDWPAGQATLPWPDSLPLGDETAYQLQLSSAATPTSVTIVQFPELEEDVDTIASALVALGCRGQLDQLIQTAEASPAE